jgi:tetratricopeptide (TPR) repeat protein
MERLLHEGEGILLIFDNARDVDALKRYLPRGGAAQVLVTSNAHAWRGVAEPVEIRVWPKEIGAEYLVARTGRPGERDAALALSDALSGLPLAHEQAAAYIERLDVTLTEYRRRFEAAPVRLLDDTHHAPAEYHDGRTVAKTFALAIDEAANLHPAAEPLIVHAALLAPEPIPLFLFAEAREKFGEPLGSALAGDGLDEAVAALRAFALVDRGVIPDERDPPITTDTIRLHRLVREVAVALRKGSAQENVRRELIEALAAVYPQQVYDDPQTWPRARRLDALVVALVDRDVAPPDGTEAHVWHLLTCLAAYRERALGAYDQARPLYERALAICELYLGPEDEIIATSLNNLAVLLDQEGNYVRSITLYERALAMDEKLFGRDHPKVATALGNLALALDAQGDHAQARLFMERSLAIRERALGAEHPATATSLNNLSGILMHLDDIAGARALCERGLMIREKMLDPEHTETALSLHNLASILHAQGDTRASRQLFERALGIREKVLGDAHPHTNYTRRDLARLLLDLGNATEGLSLSERALDAHDQALGPKHSWTRGTASITAKV